MSDIGFYYVPAEPGGYLTHDCASLPRAALVGDDGAIVVVLYLLLRMDAADSGFESCCSLHILLDFRQLI